MDLDAVRNDDLAEPAAVARHQPDASAHRDRARAYSRHEHLSADQVLAIVNQRHPETSRATVYNTLNLFVEKKLIREVIVDPSRVFYDPNTAPHYHLYDVDTGQSHRHRCAHPRTAARAAEGMTEGMDIILRRASAAEWRMDVSLPARGAGRV